MPRYSDIDFNSSQLSDVDLLYEALKVDREWGLVVYRCSYESQEKWDLFLSITKQRIGYGLREDDDYGADLVAKLKWTTIEDPIELDGATVETTSRRFVDWARSEILKAAERGDENQQEESWFLAIPRYKYFIHADAAMVDAIHADFEYLDPVENDHGPQWSNQGKNHIFLIDASTLFQLEDSDGEE